MNRWYTSDHHFGHSNIIKYCSRPFRNADDMDRAMVARWNEVVEDSDEVWILGDLAMGNPQRSLAAHVSRLKGNKILVPGNHDRCWVGHKGHIGERADYYNIGGIEQIIDRPDPHTIAGQVVRLDHFPYRHDSTYGVKYAQYRPEDDGGWLLHGHIHANWRQQHRQINVGVDAWNFAPVSEHTIADIIAQGPAEARCPDYSDELLSPTNA